MQSEINEIAQHPTERQWDANPDLSIVIPTLYQLSHSLPLAWSIFS